MKSLLNFLTFSVLISTFSCSENEDPNLEYVNLKEVEIGDYVFEFPSHFELIEKQGIDSYVGEVVGSGITFIFDFGVYTRPYENLSSDRFDVTNEKDGTVEKQLVIGKDPGIDFTGVHIRNLEGSNSLGNYISLQMSTVDLSKEQQKLAVKILKSGQLKE
ncbi:MAG: hypothetical protein RIM99_13955 [Cyclobacteriaceae bacterium]